MAKKMNPFAKDAKADKKAGIKEGSKRDEAIDKKKGIKEEPKKGGFVPFTKGGFKKKSG